ncbi:MAG: hypothetical protein E6H55_11550 [Betaproteobacteria bacterium]|nr:MAG: hypothetical protein E6H55_11550 [Betaproteobacteria bacterium]
MKARTLVTQRLYFGLKAIDLRAATGRVLSRVVGLPPERARVSARHLRQDFGVDTVQGNTLVEQLVAEGLLEPPGELQADYGVTERFVEYASARVVEPLPRERARQLLVHACELATRVNGQWTHNPLEIEAVAPFGCYMSRDRQLAELPLGIVVRPRARRARWGRAQTKSDGAREIRAQFRELSSFIHVRMVNDTRRLPRPFAVAFHADSPALVASPSSHPA